MARLIMLIAFVAVVLVAITALLGTMQAVAALAKEKEEDQMPDTFKRVAYITLIVLMFGVTSGWLGAP